MNYRKEIVSARKELDPLIREIKGLCFMGFSLENTRVLANYFAANVETMTGYEPRLAFTKAIVVDYGRLWKKAENQFVQKLDKSFYDLENTPVHNELIEIRDKLVAHVDKGYETLAVVLDGTTVTNDVPRENRHESVFLGMSLRGEGKGFLWWINNVDTVQRIADHIEKYRQLTYEKLKATTQVCLEVSQRYGHVIRELEDIVAFREFEDQGGGERRQLDIIEGSIQAPDEKELKIGRLNLTATISLYASGVFIPSEEVRTAGYVFTIDEGKFNVAFIDHTPPKPQSNN